MTTSTTPRSGYAQVNGLNMYYEIHGDGQPLLLLHGAFSGIGTSFGKLLPGLAEGRQVIGVELQAHGRTADIDRPLDLELLAEDAAAFLQTLNIEQADVFGYSNGAAVALRLAVRYPKLVRKQVLASIGFKRDGIYPELWAGLEQMKPEMMYGSPFHDEYLRLAPDPEHFPTFFAKKTEMDRNAKDVPDAAIRAITAPTLLIIGDSDIVPPEHIAEFFRLLGGGVIGDLAGLPRHRLAILPGTTHVTVVDQVNLLLPMITSFLDAPMPEV